MERKKSFQMKQRFDRCKTPMGSVPISVIMGFDYPLGNIISNYSISPLDISIHFIKIY